MSQTPTPNGPGRPDDSSSASPPRTPAGPPPAPSGASGSFAVRYREVTVASIVFGVVVGAIMNAAITYAGLKIGFTIVGSAIAAVLGFGVLRGVLRRGSILEINIAQTVASAVNTPNSGVIFTVPVLLLLGYNLSIDSANFWLITLACVAGAVLGGAFIVPLRKQMLDIERLRFPSATAVAAILKSPGAGAKKSIVLLVGIIVSALIAIPAQFPALTRPASVDALEDLVERERITRADMLLTRQIDEWIIAESAPPELVEHGRLAGELVRARAENQPEAKQGLSAEDAAARTRRVKELELLIANANARAVAAIANAEEIPSDRARLEALGYPLELAKRAHAASAGEAEWNELRSVNAGWAADRPFGYADLQIRLGKRVLEGALPADFEFDGLGTPNPVLEIGVDRDRSGVPDLIVQDDRIDVGRLLGLPAQMQLIFAIAPFALGAGYLTGRAGLFVLAGGVLAYLVINPTLYGMGWLPGTVRAHEVPDFVFGSINRPLGIGLLLGGALMGVVSSLPAIKSAFKSIAAAGATRGIPVAKDELGMRVLIVAVLAALVLLFIAADFTGSKPINTVDPITQERIESTEFTTTHNGYTIAFAAPDTLEAFENATPERRNAEVKEFAANKPGLLAGMDPHLRAAIIAIVGALWIWFAGIIIAQCTGMTDWSPISGMALLTVVLIMLLGGPGGVIGAVLIGAALCVAITCAADMMADLKTGYLVGASPKKQQTVELIATGVGPLITMGVLLVIVATNLQKFGAPIGPGTDTVAPQAQALQAVITGVQGGAMPYALYGFGALIGALLGLGAFAGLGVLVGLSIYLPMLYISTYGIGCLINMGVSKLKGPKWAEEWGVPLAAGFIVGDALLSLGVNAAVLLLG
ncbi:MAG: OPT/YSL family transporter [Phycisphaerales bacterium]